MAKLVIKNLGDMNPDEAPKIIDKSGKPIEERPEDLYDPETLQLLKKSGIIK